MGNGFLVMHKLHLIDHVADKLVLNFIKKVRSIVTSLSPKKHKEGSLKNQQLLNVKQQTKISKTRVFLRLITLNNKAIKCKTDLELSISKNSTSMSKFEKEEAKMK